MPGMVTTKYKQIEEAEMGEVPSVVKACVQILAWLSSTGMTWTTLPSSPAPQKRDTPAPWCNEDRLLQVKHTEQCEVYTSLEVPPYHHQSSSTGGGGGEVSGRGHQEAWVSIPGFCGRMCFLGVLLTPRIFLALMVIFTSN